MIEGKLNIKIRMEEGKIIPTAFIEDKEVGFICCEIIGETVIVHAVYVLEEYRHKGIGTMLWKEAEKFGNWIQGETGVKNVAMQMFLDKVDCKYYQVLKFRKNLD